MLKSVRFEDFKAFESLLVPLSPFTVIIGPNGVGKSTVLDGLHLLLSLGLRNGIAQNDKFGRFSLVFRDDSAPGRLVRKPNARSFAIEVEEQQVKEQLGLSLGFNAELDSSLAFSKITVRASGSEDLTLPGGPSAELFFLSLELLNRARVLRFWPDVWALRRPSLAADAEPQMMPNGEGLPGVIDFMISQRDGSIEQVEGALRKLVPSFSRIHIPKIKHEWIEKDVDVLNGQKIERQVTRSGPGRALELEFERVGRVPAAHVSEGTLLALSILTAVHGPAKPTLFLLDDVDRALHPPAQLELVRLLKSIVQETRGLQIVTTAHAPMVVAACEAEEVARLGFGDDGKPRTLPSLGDPPWMTPSEIMSAYFGVVRISAAELIQRYALLAGDARRSDDEDRELKELTAKLNAMDAAPGWEPVARESA